MDCAKKEEGRDLGFNHEKIKSILSTSISKAWKRLLEVDTVIWTQNFHLLRLDESDNKIPLIIIFSNIIIITITKL